MTFGNTARNSIFSSLQIRHVLRQQHDIFYNDKSHNCYENGNNDNYDHAIVNEVDDDKNANIEYDNVDVADIDTFTIIMMIPLSAETGCW